jgi:NADH-quinone oxidoreductase subunit G
MPSLTIDGKKITVKAGTTIMNAAEQLGVVVPHYCYHEALSIAGNCRMCMVEVEKQPKPVIACKTECQEGMVVHTSNENVKKLREAVLEFLLINHPLDCPVCDQAGECALQDYYMTYGLYNSRLRE